MRPGVSRLGLGRRDSQRQRRREDEARGEAKMKTEAKLRTKSISAAEPAICRR